MPLITGTLTDFKTDLMSPYSPQIEFMPSGPATNETGTFLLATKPIIVTPDADGTFSVFLFPNELSRPATWYTVSIKWLHPEAGFIGQDFLPWKVSVPVAGGSIGSMIDAPLGRGMVWITSDGAEPAGSTHGDLIFNTTTDDLTRII